MTHRLAALALLAALAGCAPAAPPAQFADPATRPADASNAAYNGGGWKGGGNEWHGEWKGSQGGWWGH